ncbi:hypothetical protein [Chiayiivirga flava]|uniref:Uncharacterized protein n=1 Tax=Chiayiivirga flava TaxID=659595 RepID=A0A7W8D251_9GAMM|nr:hypothetical protein [Chiayiivirga flava]MBB5206494.1 hypothetical protein [Chiayiivirga flava]
MPMSRPFALCAAIVLCIAAHPQRAHAHAQLPSETWCEAGVEVVLATFQISPQTLVDLRVADECPPPGSPVVKDCGQFDDDYGIAKSAAGAACAAYMPRKQPPGDFGSVIVVVEAPAQYNAETHHVDYDVQQGLSGACVRCDRPRPDEALPPRTR